MKRESMEYCWQRGCEDCAAGERRATGKRETTTGRTGRETAATRTMPRTRWTARILISRSSSSKPTRGSPPTFRRARAPPAGPRGPPPPRAPPPAHARRRGDASALPATPAAPDACPARLLAAPADWVGRRDPRRTRHHAARRAGPGRGAGTAGSNRKGAVSGVGYSLGCPVQCGAAAEQVAVAVLGHPSRAGEVGFPGAARPVSLSILG